MAQPQKGKNLESLMMAYADLSGSSRGSSFKGPPLKEVKVSKPAAPAFTASSKARDWSSLEQALEDAFTMGPPPTAKIDSQQTSSNLSAFSLWEGSQAGSQLVNLTLVQQVNPPQPVRQQSVDDWGDFQDFQSPTECKAPPSMPLPSTTTVTQVINEDDDFADFVTASSTNHSVIPLSNQHVNPQMKLVNPVIHQKLTNPSFPQLPSNLLSRPTPTFPSQPVNPSPGLPNAVNPTPVLSNSVGMRLASFQEESPVHNFRGSNKHEPGSQSPSRFEAFFGEHDKTFRFETTTTTSLPPPSSFSQIGDNSFSSLPMSVLPSPMPLSNDKYGALSDLLSMSELSSFSTLATPPQSTATLPQTLPRMETTFGVSNHDSTHTTFKTDFCGNPTGATTTNHFVSSTQEEEDFGDFITVQEVVPKPVLSTSGSYSNFANFAPTPSSQQPQSKYSNIMSWHESSPPPMPMDDDLHDHEIEEINTSNHSIIHDDILADNYFQPKTQDLSQKLEQFPTQYSSPPDSLSLNSFEESSAHQSHQDSGSHNSNPELSSPQNESIQNNKIEIKVRSFTPPNPDLLKSPYREWSQALTQILEILSSGADTFSNISKETILDEVLESSEGNQYLRNVVEIYRVFKRIQLSYSMAIWNDAVQSQCEETEKAWKALLVNLKSKTQVIPNRGVFDFSSSVVNGHVASAQTVCGICLLSVSVSSKEICDVVKENILNVEQKKYHSTCANFWVNCVSAALPKLI